MVLCRKRVEQKIVEKDSTLRKGGRGGAVCRKEDYPGRGTLYRQTHCWEFAYQAFVQGENGGEVGRRRVQ